MKPIVFLFSGQGAQYYQMGFELYQREPFFREWMDTANQLVSHYLPISLLDQLYHPTHKKTDAFTDILYTHPSIFAVEYALAKLLISINIKPDYVVGSSLGEFAAAAIANVLSFEDALFAVCKQAEVIKHACKPAGMLAIFADPNLFEKENSLFAQTELAARNFSQHFVISGENKRLEEIEHYFSKKNITTFRLPVSYGFHSFYIDDAREKYVTAIQHLKFTASTLPFVSARHARVMPTLNAEHGWELARHPILFQETVAYLEQKNNYTYIDIGPSGTLATFVKYNLSPSSASEIFPIMTPYGQDDRNLANIIAKKIT